MPSKVNRFNKTVRLISAAVNIGPNNQRLSAKSLFAEKDKKIKLSLLLTFGIIFWLYNKYK
jgi:dipeptide/tripeptide permease